MKICILKEALAGETRVAVVPTHVSELVKLGHQVFFEPGAGVASGHHDDAYQAAGATRITAAEYAQIQVFIKIRPPTLEQIARLPSHSLLVSLIWPFRNPELLEQLSARAITTIALDRIPRTTIAQKMDVLSSMANIAGYRAVLAAAGHFEAFFTGQITAAGKVSPAKVLVIGAGVAGLAAIGAAKALGAIVRAFDTRLEVKDQVKSMGAQFLELEFTEDGSGSGGYAKIMSPEFIKAEMELFAKQAKEIDIIITTAAVPGAKAPILLTKECIEQMRPGSVIVDLAAEQGGNCELTQLGQVVQHKGVKILGYPDLTWEHAAQASTLFSNNIANLLKHLGLWSKADFSLTDLNFNEEILGGSHVTHAGKITLESSKPAPAKPAAIPTPSTPAAIKTTAPKKRWSTWIVMAIALVLLAAIALAAPASFLTHFTVFVLACIIGWQVVWSVTPALHTPLMSVTNAISGIIILAALLQLWGPIESLPTILAFVAIFLSVINIAGGFLVTKRMLNMFKK